MHLSRAVSITDVQSLSSPLGTVTGALALRYVEMQSSAVTPLLEFRFLLKLLSSEKGFRMEEKKKVRDKHECF